LWLPSIARPQILEVNQVVHGKRQQIRALWTMAGQFAEDYEDMSFTPARLSGIRARTLIGHGDAGPLYPLGLATELHQSIPRSRLWVIPGGGHGPTFGDMAGRFAEAAIAFLDGR
jgi:pimeloyl-ACP methyl ester carboxylesterase